MTWIAQSTSDWTTWTPTLTATGSNPSGFSASGGTNVYQRLGDLVVVRYYLYTPSSGGNSVGTGEWRMSLPVQPKHSAGYVACGNYYVYNADSSAYAWYGNVALHSTSQSASTVAFVAPFSSGNSIYTLPISFSYPSATFSLNGQLFYEAL